jgi:DNA-binding response OmpR family regulator
VSARPVRSAAAADAGAEPRDATIVVAESCTSVGRALVEQLCADCYRAVHAHTAEHARTLARARPIRAIVLGALDSSRGALDLLEEIRGSTRAADHETTVRRSSPSVWDEHTPAIVLGGGGRLELLRAFEMGADDFVARAGSGRVGADWAGPSYLELRARLRAVLRRMETRPGKRLLCVGPLVIDTEARLARIDGAPVELCRLEYQMLVHLAANPTGVCSKQELLRTIWDQRVDAGARTVDSHASRLRRKLDAAGATGLVVNVWGVGYRLT